MTRASAGRVVVVGSGAAGVSAALSAARTGAHVTLLERASVLGGTTSYSAGWPWIPANPRAGEVGATDSESEALTYAHSLDLGDWDWPRVETYVRSAHVVMQAIEDATTVRWRVLDFPDYQAERPGGWPRAGGPHPSRSNRTRVRRRR
jgi:3-oxosteroid 1-dehydrogenase